MGMKLDMVSWVTIKIGILYRPKESCSNNPVYLELGYADSCDV